MNLNWKYLITLVLSVFFTSCLYANQYEWNKDPIVKAPVSGGNGKTVYFDVSHGGTEGNADWVIDGAFSDFADALVAEGYTVVEYRGVDLNGNGKIEWIDDYNTPANADINEAIITYDAIAASDVFVLAETNRPFTIAEYAALKQYVDAGKGIFFIADHYDADRNLNTWDSTEVFNGYNRSDLAKYNLHNLYGDLRNPKSANAGWLAENFGIRFRFNAIDLKAGVSDVIAPSLTEGLTQGVAPILMAGGATLAITDPNLAKGLVYIAPTDNATKWNYAKDSGIYFGGQDEGPYVAISKPSLGKAAFIGDSSPIEDATPKYRRQDSGSTKKTYPGWTDPGHASVLSINIINWLANTEDYVGFNTAAHPAGFMTPIPLADEEKTDPNNGQPWRQPSNGYLPWDPSSFANGSFGAPCPLNGCSGGGDNGGGDNGGEPSDSLTVAQALNTANGTDVVVEGVIKAELNGIYALLLADSSNNSITINVKLESSQRAQFSPNLNPQLIGQKIRVTGRRDTYMSGPSIEYVSSIELVSAYLSVSQALAEPVGTEVEVVGIIQSELNGIYALLLADENASGTTINVKLESTQRATFSPSLNPDLIGKKLLVKGRRDNYMSAPSIEYVSELTLLDSTGGGDNSGGEPNNPTDAISVSDALALSEGTDVKVIGQITSALNGQYALVLSEGNQDINIKLPSEYRNQFSPERNPSILNQTIIVEGRRDRYMSAPSVEYISSIQLAN
ncbi:hypothetical protein HR060_02265 [Catenovulum sp. SM1970]|uniref:DUF6359 domain-containing protein n=1 Tax=Marinifaba aquimaris TaxID=2741323 RepID=UPI0015746F59|nr:DUF6359 domain-containing protein [Marinifaba aquimaris]NTS75680.1 hypothetical protein [Marinifaba aquimaris]